MNAQHQEFYEEPEEKFDIRGYIQQYLRFWYLFPIFISICLIGAWYYLQVTPPVYQATTTLLIKEKQDQMQAIMEEMAQFNGNKILDNEIVILKSQMIMGQVIEELGLDVSVDTKDGLKTVDLYANSPAILRSEVVTDYAYSQPLTIHFEDSLHFRFNDEAKLQTFGNTFRNSWGIFKIERGTSAIKQKDITFHFHSPAALTRALVNRLAVSVVNSKSTVLQLSFEDTSIQRAKDILNKLLDVYVQSSLNDKNSEASNTLKFIETRLGLITGELNDVEKDVEIYKTTRGLTDLSEESRLYLENVQASDTKLSEINTQIKILESIESYIENTSTENVIAPAIGMVTDPVLVSLLNRFSELVLQREKYERTMQAGNPILETINSQLTSTRQAIRENVQNIRRGMDMSRQNLENINLRFSSGLKSIPQKEREYVGIKRQQTIKENLYLYLLQKREETALAYASTVTDSRLIDAPISSFLPIKPKRSSVWLGAFGAGILLPMLIIYGLTSLNNTVQNRTEIERATKVSVIGEIGQMKANKAASADSEIIKMTSRSAVAEQFRALRTNLQYLGDGNCKTIMFTSSVGGEGKSFASINLAASLAYSDKRVILIGLDLRKPTLHERLQISNSKGVSNYLIGQKDLNELIQSTAVHPGLDVVTSGPIPPNPSELIANGQLTNFLRELRARYDYILIDCAPHGLVTDASIVADHVDATLYLVRHNYTSKDALKQIGKLNSVKRFANLSIVYNGVGYGSGYGYGYGGYGYGYYSESDSEKPGSKMFKIFS